MWSFFAAIPFRYTAESLTNHEEEFSLLAGCCSCCLVCSAMCSWLVSLGPLIWNCTFISLCLEAALEIILFCPASVTLARCVARPVVCHQFVCIQSPCFFLYFYKYLNHILQNEASLGRPVPSSASLAGPWCRFTICGLLNMWIPSPRTMGFFYFFSMPFSSWDLSSWVYSLATGRQQSAVVL